jgi:broad specificity phosphatase PhoE
MKNRYIFLRHAETQKLADTPVVNWPLVDDALLKINEYIEKGEFENITKIISSTESKAIATAKPILGYLNRKRNEAGESEIVLELNENIVEVKREKKFLTDDEFADQKMRELTNIETVENGAESANVALERFLNAISEIEEKHENENILIVSHGTILSLYFAYLQNEMQHVYVRWKNVKFCAIGKVENGKVMQDIIS